MSGFWPHDEQLLKAVLDWSYRRIVAGQDPMTSARPAAELRAAAGSTVTPDGIGGFEALRIFTQTLLPATRAQDNEMNLAYVPAATTEAALVFDLAVSAAEVFGGHWDAGAGAIYAENEALDWIVGLLGWPETAGGCFVSGGTIGNLSALTAAREKARREGRGAPWRLVASEDAHSSVASAARVLDATVLAVPTDDGGRLRAAAVAEALAGEPPDGVFAVVASAGTTNSGAVDELDGLADVCAEHGLWLHVDGAYGGAALCAPSVRDRFAGVERADSFIVDPHKWLFAPYDCCALLYREPEHAVAAHTQSASYLDTVSRAERNPSDLAIHLSRRVRGLPLWFSLATYGTDRYRSAVEHVLTLARRVAEEIRSLPHLELVLEPELSVVLFRRVGWDLDDYTAWSTRNARAGIVLCLPTRWRGEPVLRLCFVNPDTAFDRVRAVLESLAR